MTRLSETQTTLLAAAAARNNSSLLPLPENLKARGTVLKRAIMSLVKRGLAEETRVRSEAATWRRGEDGTRIGLVITAAGMGAIGLIPVAANGDQAQMEANPTAAAGAHVAKAASHPGGKLGSILKAIDKDGGATIGELASAAAWRPHTTRAALTRLRQRGFDIRIETLGDRRAYRLHAEG